MRSDTEIAAQIEGLKAIAAKPTFRKTTLFGDSNADAIESQIEVLEEKLTEDDVMDREDEGDFSDHAASSARDAANWLEGDSEDEPVKGWDGLH